MQKFYQELFPIEKAQYDVLGTNSKQSYAELTSEKDQKAFKLTHKIDVKTKACDTLRCLLPLATKTNVGLFGNGRFFQSLISHLLSSSYEEVTRIGQQTFDELSKIIPKYIHRAGPKKYCLAIDQEMKKIAEELFPRTAPVAHHDHDPVYLVPLTERDTEEYLIANMLYPYTQLSFADLHHHVCTLDTATRNRIKKTYIGDRASRRDRPGRALESGYTHTFDLCTDFGTYKDLMRHRMSTQQRQIFSPMLGMIIPQDLHDAGFSDRITACHERVAELYQRLVLEVGNSASYVVLHGHRVRWLMGLNDRSLMHMLELRTTKQGHPQYRKLCQLMHSAVATRDPWRADMMKFVDHQAYDSARGDSEARQRVKERLLEEKNKKPTS